MSFHPHVQSFAIATDRIGIDIIKNSDAVYDCGMSNDQDITEEQRWEIINRYEIGMSRQIINAGYSINSLTGALGHSLTVKKDDFQTIIERSQYSSKPLQNSNERNIWDSSTESNLLPFGEDIWNEHALLSVGNGKLPSWSDFVFFKASREILLPEVEEELQYNNPKLTIIRSIDATLPAFSPLPVFDDEISAVPGVSSPTNGLLSNPTNSDTSIPPNPEMVTDMSNDICEVAKTNCRQVSRLGVIVTGYEHSGIPMMGQILRSAPNLFGGFECGLLLSRPEIYKPFYDWLIYDIQ